MLQNNIKDKDIIINTYNYKLIINKNYSDLLKNVKVLNKKSVFLTGIPIEIEKNELTKYEYLGQYGKIINIIKSKVKKNLKLKTYSIFVTFESKIICALAINSLNNFKFRNKIMKCSFASNKLCIDKIFSGNCDKPNCYFFHGTINKSNSIIKILDNTNLKIIEFFSQKSKKILKNSYMKIIEKYYRIKMDSTVFPNVNIFLSDFFKND